ncbi:hypothetical protein BRE01_48470 [Brevibacillus reuszeri]|uniref:Cadherin domain-containing protein n=1 Tax=Brevibacillus reuszeri TaxID=54915 RepID=A0ABQ0TTC0_9BACL|nr:hypothetical protein [Brevibacillus reuszeri]MED1860069.1 hypothetical protein [Brevibacillus reuszeri]GED71145.1 hypothetical protein BRE01_48470 [Brevibacillus reuszeri]
MNLDFDPSVNAFTYALNLNDHFSDPEGEPLTYTIASSELSILTASFVNTEEVELQRVNNNTGTVVITITASDVHGAFVSTSFTVRLL